ncbi:MAG: hypothetical protein IJM90_07805 [Firmicutes bacterium]|nr:hypothetical protein [Bacillota bacterium]
MEKSWKYYVILFVLVISEILIVGCSEKTVIIPVKEYIAIKYNGFEGAGAAELVVDYDRLKKDYSSKIIVKDKSITSDSVFEHVFSKALSYQIENNGKLKNGDKVKITWSVNLEVMKQISNIQLIEGEISGSVEGLKPGYMTKAEYDEKVSALVSSDFVITVSNIRKEQDGQAPLTRFDFQVVGPDWFFGTLLYANKNDLRNPSFVSLINGICVYDNGTAAESIEEVTSDYLVPLGVMLNEYPQLRDLYISYVDIEEDKVVFHVKNTGGVSGVLFFSLVGESGKKYAGNRPFSVTEEEITFSFNELKITGNEKIVDVVIDYFRYDEDTLLQKDLGIQFDGTYIDNYNKTVDFYFTANEDVSGYMRFNYVLDNTLRSESVSILNGIGICHSFYALAYTKDWRTLLDYDFNVTIPENPLTINYMLFPDIDLPPFEKEITVSDDSTLFETYKEECLNIFRKVADLDELLDYMAGYITDYFAAAYEAKSRYDLPPEFVTAVAYLTVYCEEGTVGRYIADLGWDAIKSIFSGELWAHQYNLIKLKTACQTYLDLEFPE